MRDSDARVMADPRSSAPDNGSSLEISRNPISERPPSAVENALGVRGSGRYEADICDIDDIDDGQPRYASGTSSAMGAVANFMNSIVGAGIVGLPYALAQSGLWAGMFMICLAAFLTYTSTTMLITVGEKANRLNYEELMAQVFGAGGFHSFNFFAGTLAFGAMSAYLIVVGDAVTEIARAAGHDGMFADYTSVVLFLGTLVVLPVASLKDLAKLSYTSFMSVLADLLLVCLVVWNGPDESQNNFEIDRSETLEFIRPTIFAGFGAVSFAFVCQSSSFLVYRSMTNRSVEKWARVSRFAVSAAAAMSLTLAFAGYASFVNTTEDNILNNFSTNHKPANVARGFLAVTMVLTYPIEMYVTRHVLDASVFQTLLGLGPITSVRHYGITGAVWFLSMLLALSTRSLGDIMEVFGAFAASMIGYVMPALLYLQVNRAQMRGARATWRPDSPQYESSMWERLWAIRNLLLPVFMVIFGLVAMIAGVATAIIQDLSPTRN